MNRRAPSTLLLFVVVLALVGATPSTGEAQAPDSIPAQKNALPAPSPDTIDRDAPYVPTAQPIVEKMLAVAEIDSTDVVFDLGSGDGRIVITAATKYGAEGVGIEIDPELVAKARGKARAAGVSNQVEFRQGDLFKADLSEATVVTLYLWPEMNLKLRPKLLRELDPGDKILSHDFRIGDWTPDRVVDLGRGNTGRETAYLWIVPEEIPDHLMEISDEQK